MERLVVRLQILIVGVLGLVSLIVEGLGLRSSFACALDPLLPAWIRADALFDEMQRSCRSMVLLID